MGEKKILDFQRYKKIKDLKNLINQVPKKAVYILGIVLAAIILLIILRLAIGHKIAFVKTVTELEKSSTYDYGMYDDKLLVANLTGYTAYNKDGKVKFEGSAKVQKPLVYSNGDYALFLNSEGESYELIYKEKVLVKEENAQHIITGDVNKNGYYVIVSQEPGYKSVATVYNKNKKQIYKYYSADNYILDVSLSKNNKNMAVLLFDSSKTQTSTILSVFDFKYDSVISSVSFVDELAFDINYQSSGNILVLSDKKAAAYNKNGKQKWDISYEGRKLHTYDIKDDGGFVLALEKVTKEETLKNSQVEIYSNSGHKRGDYSVDGIATRVNFKNGKCLIATKNQMILVNKFGFKKAKGEVLKDVKAIYLFNNKMMVLTPTTLDLYKIKLGR